MFTGVGQLVMTPLIDTQFYEEGNAWKKKCLGLKRDGCQTVKKFYGFFFCQNSLP